MKNMSSQTKEELKATLRALGEEAHPRWTSLEIRSRIQELKPVKMSTASITADSKKSEMVQECEKRGLPVSQSDTKGTLLRKIRSHEEINEGVETSVMGFGRYSDITFLEVYQRDPSYCTWAVETKDEGAANDQLIKFAVWVEKYKLLPELGDGL